MKEHVFAKININTFDREHVAKACLSAKYFSENIFQILIVFFHYTTIGLGNWMGRASCKKIFLSISMINILLLLLQGISQQGLTGSSLDLLGPLLPFLDRDTLRLVDREALRLRLEELKGYCVPRDSLRDMASLITDKALLG